MHPPVASVPQYAVVIHDRNGRGVLSHRSWKRRPRTMSLCRVGRATPDAAELGFLIAEGAASGQVSGWGSESVQSQHIIKLAGNGLGNIE